MVIYTENGILLNYVKERNYHFGKMEEISWHRKTNTVCAPSYVEAKNVDPKVEESEIVFARDEKVQGKGDGESFGEYLTRFDRITRMSYKTVQNSG